MKTTSSWTVLLSLGLFFWMASIAQARLDAADLHYRFSSGQTNVYHIEVKVRAEAGEETIAGNVFVVPADAGSNVFQLFCHANLKVNSGPQRVSFGYFGGMYPGGEVTLPSKFEVQFDKYGRVLREAGDYPLPIPLGALVLVLVQRLPESQSDSRWETTDEPFVMDYPYWLGPANGFFYWEGFGFILNRNTASPMMPPVLAVSRHIDYQVVAVADDAVIIHEQLTLKSLLKTASEPRVASTAKGDLVFDRAAGMFREITLEASTLAVTEMSALNAKTSLKCRLLQGAELAAALAPPPATTPSIFKPTAEEWRKLFSELQSTDVMVRQAASYRLSDAEADSPSQDLLANVASFSTNADVVVRHHVAQFFVKYGTTNQVPALLKLLKDPDYGTHENAIKALGRIRDTRAIESLADDVARGSQSAQVSSAALINIGSAAEAAVVQLLKERSVAVRWQACNILQQIGTSKSIEPLQNLTGDPDEGVSKSAAEAIRYVKSRQ